jgi:hypothetical protein
MKPILFTANQANMVAIIVDITMSMRYQPASMGANWNMFV